MLPRVSTRERLLIRYSLAAVALFASTSAFAQDSHDISINIEATTGVEVSGGPVEFSWIAPPAGQPYSTTADSGSQSVQVSYTSAGEGGLYIDSSDDPLSAWGIDIQVTPDPTTCGTDNGPQSLTIGQMELVNFGGFGTCAETLNVTYDATISDETLFSSTNSGNLLTVTYTLF